MIKKIRYLYIGLSAIILLVTSIFLLPAGKVSATTYVSAISDKFTTVAPSPATANQTITFTTSATGGGVLASTGTIVVTWPSGFGGPINGLSNSNVTLNVGGASQTLTGGTAWTVSSTGSGTAGGTLTFTAGSAVSVAQSTVVIITTTAATIINPTTGVYNITLTSGASDTGTIQTDIVANSVTVGGLVNLTKNRVSIVLR